MVPRSGLYDCLAMVVFLAKRRQTGGEAVLSRLLDTVQLGHSSMALDESQAVGKYVFVTVCYVFVFSPGTLVTISVCLILFLDVFNKTVECFIN